jgi:hypothetical protein
MKRKSIKNKRSKYKNRSECSEQDEMKESTNIKSLLSKFVTDIFEKNYSNANSTLTDIISEKMKPRIKKAAAKKRKPSCGCDDYEK